MAKDKLISPSFCYILAANFLLFFAFYLILPILPFYLQDQFDADKSPPSASVRSPDTCWTHSPDGRCIS